MLEPDTRAFKLFLSAFSAATLLLLTRSIFRVVELVGGFKSALANNQVAFMVFESGSMLLVGLAMTVWHPGVYVGERLGEGLRVDLDKIEFEIQEPERLPRSPDVFNRPWPLGEPDLMQKLNCGMRNV